MNNTIESPDKKKKSSWRKSTEVDGITKSINVEEILCQVDGKLKPAFLVCYEKYGEVDGKYDNTSKKVCMMENPLSDDDQEEEKDESDKIKDDYKGWFDNPMMEV